MGAHLRGFLRWGDLAKADRNKFATDGLEKGKPPPPHGALDDAAEGRLKAEEASGGLCVEGFAKINEI